MIRLLSTRYLEDCLDVPGMGYNLLLNGVYWGEISQLLTIDPNFQRGFMYKPYKDSLLQVGWVYPQ